MTVVVLPGLFSLSVTVKEHYYGGP